MHMLRLRFEKPPQPEPESPLKHIVLEAMASILTTYAAIYVPEAEADYLKQYVGSVCILAIVMALKDSHYFFPDATPMTTAVLWAATLYTDERGHTDWGEIARRLFGQLVGYSCVFCVAAANRDVLRDSAYLVDYDCSDATHALNEGLGTLIEGVAIAYATIPLLSPYTNDSGIQSKAEANPPNNAHLWPVALSLALIHYTLEQLFQGTMSPLVTVLQYNIQDRLQDVGAPVVCQLVGLGLACLYVQWCAPSAETLSRLRGPRN